MYKDLSENIAHTFWLGDFVLLCALSTPMRWDASVKKSVI